MALPPLKYIETKRYLVHCCGDCKELGMKLSEDDEVRI
jgi:hypothetical protein